MRKFSFSPKAILSLVLVLLLISACIPYDVLESDTGIRITQAVLFAVAQRRIEDGSYVFSRVFLFPSSLHSIENLHKKEISLSPPVFSALPIL